MKLKEAQLLGVLALIAVGIILLCMWGSDEAPDGTVAIDDAADLIDGGTQGANDRAQQLLDELLRPDEPVVVRQPAPPTVRIGIGGPAAVDNVTEGRLVDDAIYERLPHEIPLTQPEPEERAVRRPIAPKPKTIIHVVQKGDTLGEISAKYYGTSRKVKEIQRANGNVDPRSLPIGMALKIPPLGRTLSAASPASGATRRTLAASGTGPAKARRTYIVKKDDSLYKIAQRFYSDGTRYKDIQQANSQAIPRADQLKPGMEIVIP